MIERELRGVEELALEPEILGRAVGRVARDRQLDRLQVNADLVRAAGLERELEERARAEQLEHLEVRDRVAGRRGVERVTRLVQPVAADRRLDPARPRTRRPLHEREVAALDPATADQLLEALVRLVR